MAMIKVIDLGHQKEGGIVTQRGRGNIRGMQVLLIVGFMIFMFLNFLLMNPRKGRAELLQDTRHNFCPNTPRWDVPKTMVLVLGSSWVGFRED